MDFSRNCSSNTICKHIAKAAQALAQYKRIQPTFHETIEKSMKKLFLLVFFFPFYSSDAQTVGVINDPDGYTNIRSNEGTDSKVVGELKEGDSFLYYADEKSSWWKVTTTPHFGKPIEGYVHKSRIQPYYLESISNCQCPQEYGQDGSKPVLVANLGKTTLAVCGYLLQRAGENAIKISEFTVSDCSSNEVLRFYGAVTTCQVRAKGSSLEIIELDRLPIGERFQWIQTPYRKVEIRDVNGTPKFGDEQYVLDLSMVTDADINAFVRDLPKYKNKGYFDEVETFIGKLLVCSLKGNEQCKTIFNDIDSYLNFVLDGAYAKFYNDCRNVLENSKSG